MTINYSEYKNLPKYIQDMNYPWNFLNKGIYLVEYFNNKFSTHNNKEYIKEIIVNFFGIDIKDSRHIKIYVGEFRTVFIDIEKFKIYVFVDVD